MAVKLAASSQMATACVESQLRCDWMILRRLSIHFWTGPKIFKLYFWLCFSVNISFLYTRALAVAWGICKWILIIVVTTLLELEHGEADTGDPIMLAQAVSLTLLTVTSVRMKGRQWLTDLQRANAFWRYMPSGSTAQAHGSAPSFLKMVASLPELWFWVSCRLQSVWSIRSMTAFIEAFHENQDTV